MKIHIDREGMIYNRKPKWDWEGRLLPVCKRLGVIEWSAQAGGYIVRDQRRRRLDGPGRGFRFLTDAKRFARKVQTK